MVKNRIPTAIVKPKYQRSSFDDRQLPTIAYMNEDKVAWYEKQNNTNEMIKCSAPMTTVTATHPKKIQLPEFDRKKHMKSAISVNSARNTTETIITSHNNLISATDNTTNSTDGIESVRCVDISGSVVRKSKKSNASVAVVQPRKKERIDERKLMETILQMQIKKNALLYREQGNNNKTVVTTSTVNQTRSGNVNNNNNLNNNNNGEYGTNSEVNQAKKDPKENSGIFHSEIFHANFHAFVKTTKTKQNLFKFPLQ